MNWTPLMITILLHYHTVCEPYAVNEPEHAKSQAVKEHKAWLLNNGYIKPELATDNGSGYTTTEKAKCVIGYWINAPEPVWRMPNE